LKNIIETENAKKLIGNEGNSKNQFPFFLKKRNSCLKKFKLLLP